MTNLRKQIIDIVRSHEVRHLSKGLLVEASIPEDIAADIAEQVVELLSNQPAGDHRAGLRGAMLERLEQIVIYEDYEHSYYPSPDVAGHIVDAMLESVVATQTPINPEPPVVRIHRCATVEELHRAMWQEAAAEVGLTYEQMMSEATGHGQTETGEEVEMSPAEQIMAIKSQGMWAFVDTRINLIYAWAAEDAPEDELLHMLAHEIGHITGEQNPDELQEELRADQFGRVAKRAYHLLREMRLQSRELPLQPLRFDPSGKIRFRENRIVTHLLGLAERDGRGEREIEALDFTDAERAQFVQLLGYNVSVFKDMSFVPEHLSARAEAVAREMLGQPRNPDA